MREREIDLHSTRGNSRTGRARDRCRSIGDKRDDGRVGTCNHKDTNVSSCYALDGSEEDVADRDKDQAGDNVLKVRKVIICVLLSLLLVWVGRACLFSHVGKGKQGGGMIRETKHFATTYSWSLSGTIRVPRVCNDYKECESVGRDSEQLTLV